MKIKLVENDITKVELERVDERVFVHCEVYKWSKEIYRDLLELFVDIRELVRNEGVPALYCSYMLNDVKGQHFATMFGFTIEKVSPEIVIMKSEV